MKTISRPILILLIGMILAGCMSGKERFQGEFNGERAYQDVVTQVEFGSRSPGTPGHQKALDWIMAELTGAGWQAEILESERHGLPIYNLAADRPKDESNNERDWVILGAHYDTRFFADRDLDPDARNKPVPGANDGASGVAVLLELARVLPDYENIDLTLVFFDAEDNGDIHGWDWIIGSRIFVENLVREPDAVVIVDMVGDADQNIYIEKTSDDGLVAEIWGAAKDNGIVSFIQEEKHSILDDHTSFVSRGIPAVDIIDFDYPYWHTTQDTPDKVSADSLENVGIVLLNWLKWKNQSLEQ